MYTSEKITFCILHTQSGEYLQYIVMVTQNKTEK